MPMYSVGDIVLVQRGDSLACNANDRSDSCNHAANIDGSRAIVSTRRQNTNTRPSCTVSIGVLAGSLNIRTGVGTKYPVITLLSEGQVLTLTGSRADGWIEVISGNLSGWINSKYCKGV